MTEQTYTRTKRQYLFHRWIMPLVILVTITSLVYIATEYFGLSRTDRACGFAAALFLAFYQWTKARILLLKLPDGAYHYMGATKPDSIHNDSTLLMEPTSYEKEFFYDKSKQSGNIVLGLFIIGAAYFILSKKGIILPVLLAIVGLQFLMTAIRKIVSGPVIKIAKQGIWTKKSGYLAWKKIDRISFTEKPDQKTRMHSLELFLKASPLEGEFPDYTLAIQDLKDEITIKNILAAYKPGTAL